MRKMQNIKLKSGQFISIYGIKEIQKATKYTAEEIQKARETILARFWRGFTIKQIYKARKAPY